MTCGYKKMAGTSAVFLREDYDPATHGDVRQVDSVGERFVCLERIRGWVQVEGVGVSDTLQTYQSFTVSVSAVLSRKALLG